MERLIVESSVIFTVGYDTKKGDLEISFRDGGIYLYLGVPAGIYLELMNAESKGAFFDRKIKDQFVYRKLVEPTEPTHE